MNQRHANRRYERLYYVFSKRMERRGMILIISLLILLTVYQVLLLIPGFKKNITTIDRLEGTPIHVQMMNDFEHR
ncbi:hypothetical protein C0Q44_20575 [Paenibacillus sp. PCH8]|uniref:hypothetical protein n=1 Tax=Paenibacillus sp. PCH8 TaxID=2066524 RepID=UPI000CF882E6|nr:hypothetical protein [Paenibacillus sp. PCH8]PQP82052.1 hypothetical protein C0Q44_20575 [Paenibacillus sp. PCH8]